MEKFQNPTAEDESSPQPEREDFLIVGIGASAGGVQALKTFFENVAADSNAAYVVILHLSPDHESRLTEILQSVSRIPVERVTEKVHVESNRVYVISPDESLSMADGHIIVSPIHTVEERRAPVDIFFRTLAESHCSRAVAVVLSGTGADGSMGLKRVKENGGAAFVQNPREAEFSEMPRNSIATDLIDEVLNVAEIPAKIAAYQKNLGKVVIPVEAENREAEQQAALREIFTNLRVRTGHDFANYKRPTMLRRIERRINVRNLPDLPQYTAYLKENSEETTVLLKDLLISVTNFFRDKEAFDYLRQEIVPRLLHDKTSKDEIRLWIAGCATGEEAYSLAMLLAEQIDDSIDAPAVQIFATDIDEDAIAAARNGFYTLNDAADVSPERLRRFFIQEKGGYRIRRELREMILFANHNLLKDPPFSRLDLATCRNLLIYFNRTAQHRAMETFHFALKPGAYLFLGASESVDGADDLYRTISRERHVFQTRPTQPRFSYPVPDLSPSSSAPRFDAKPPLAAARETETRPLERISYGDLHGRILEQFAPPSIVVNERFDIVHVSPRAGRYLEISGELTGNLFKLIKPDLRAAVSTAVYQAAQRQKNVRADNLKLETDGDGGETVNVSVRPVLRDDGDAATDGFILVIFEPAENAPDDAEAIFASPEPVNRQLEEALLESQSQFRQSIEHSEIQAEELKASNEELQAINEELRSASEELETGKEELQSVNEELVTVNQELKIKIEELSQSNNDLQNLMNSTNIGTIFLDRALRVKMFTPAALEIFNLIPADDGRALSDITHRLEYADLTADVEMVLSDLRTIEREVRTADDAVYLMRITPYRTAEDRIGGTIITFVNITTRKRQEDELRELNARVEQQARIFDRTLSTITDFAYIFDQDGRFVFSNRPLLDLLGITLEEIKGKNFFDLNYPEDLAARLQSQIQHVFETGETVRDETPFTSATGAPGFYEYIFNPLINADGAVESVAGSTRDISERKQREMNTAFLAELGQALIPLTDEPAIVQVFGEKISRLTNASMCGVFEINERKDEAFITSEWHRADSPGLSGIFNIPELVSHEFQRLMAAGETVVVRDIAADSHAVGKNRLAALGIGSFVNLPLVRNGEWTLVLGVYHAQPYDWRIDEIELLDEAGRRIWTKIESNRSDQFLREAEERTRIAVEAAALGTWSWDLTTNELRWSKRTFEIFGMPPHEKAVELADFFGRVHPADHALMRSNIERAIAEKSSFKDEYRIVTDDGETRWVEGYGQVVGSGEDEKPFRMSGVIMDITPRKRIEEDLRESEQRLQKAMRIETVGVVYFDDAGRLLDGNDSYLKMIGCTRQEFEERKLQTADITPPEWMSRTEQAMAELKAEGAFTPYEKELVRPDNSRRWGLFAGARLNERESIEYVIDITGSKHAEAAMRESEERLSLVMKSVEDYAIIVTDPQGIINGWNPGAAKMFGYTESEIVGRGTEILFTPEDRAGGVPAQELKEALATGSSEDERFHLRKDGSHFFVSGVMQPLKDGKLDGFVKIARDLTERIKAEQTKRDKEMLQKLVGAQEDERKRIARDLHDELGQLLTGLRLKLEAIRKSCEDNAALCGKVDETQLLAKQIDAGIDFLAWELRPAALDDLGLRAALEKYVREWSHYAGVSAELLGSGIRKERFAPEAETNLYRIVQEALNNTHKYAKAKSVEVIFDKREDSIVLIIADDGRGFDPQDKLNRDAGIGLIGMRERAALIGGTFEIESAPGEGTTIFVRVPFSAVQTENINDE